jgi:PAS domain S-box-containing protein
MVPSAEALSERLTELEERFELVLRATSEGLWDWNLLTGEIYYSPRWKAILGYEEDEIGSGFDEWQSRVHPDDLERALATVQAHLDSDAAVYELEHRLRHKDGSYRWIHARGASVRDAEGHVYRLTGSHADITDRKEAEAALREREAQYRSIFESTTDGLVITDLESGRLVEVNPAFCAMHGFTREELIDADPFLFIHQDSHHLLFEYLNAVLAGGTYHTRAVDIRKDGTPFHVEVNGGPFTYRGRACVLGVVRDITERVQAYHLLEQRVEERTRELTTLLTVSNTVASTLELKPLLGLILDELRAVVDYTGATLLTLDGDALLLVDARGVPAADPRLLGLRFPIHAGAGLDEVLSRRAPVIVGDVLGDSELAHAYRVVAGERITWPSFSYLRSWLAVPMTLNNQVTGVLSLGHARADFYTAEHARLAAVVANQAAVAIENATLYERAQDAAALEERQRLARELHDSVTQSLFSMTMITGALPRLVERDPARAVERIERLNELAGGALAEMRALIFELRPESLATEGLVVALEKQAAALRARHDLVVDVTLGDEPDVPLEVKEAVYRIAQEALHNISKHARARRVELCLTHDAEAVTLTIQDDGVGFDPAGPFPGHLGQRSMRERAGRLDGSLDIESEPGGGTRIRARVPLAGVEADS